MFLMPEHIRNMALEDRNGDGSILPILHDALLELNLPICASHYSINGMNHSAGCSLTDFLIDGKDFDELNETYRKELKDYISRSQLK